MNTRTRPITLAAAAAAVALVAAGCGSSNDQSVADKYASQATSELKNPPTYTDTVTKVNVTSATPGPGEGNLKKKPVIPKQTGKAPADLTAQDLIVGTGKTAKSGDNVSMQYVGVLYDTGKEFDSSWKRKQPFDFTLGQGAVIKGWDDGIVGMKEGGRRRLIIPADLAYGAQGSPPTIPANAALVFDVDLKKVKSAKQ